MKVKENFVLQEIVDEYLVIPFVTEADRIRVFIKLNSTGHYLWKCLLNGISEEADLVQALCSEYSIDVMKAKHDVEVFLSLLNEYGCLE